MKLSEFKASLESAPDVQLRFVLPDGGLIEAHAHITEVGRIEKTFIDCGGTIRRVVACCLQVWVADDTDHRIGPGQLAAILRKAAPILGADDPDVEIEYEDCSITQFPVKSASVEEDTLAFYLTEKHTDCLAKELCLPQAAGCEPGSGCCQG